MFLRSLSLRCAARGSTTVALALCATLGAPSAMAATLFDNLALASPGFNNGVSFQQHVGARIPVGAAAASVTEVTLLVQDQGSIGSLVVRVCNDGAGGNMPGASCTTFTALDPVPTGAQGQVRFSGTYAAPASGHIWVVANGTVPNGGPGMPGSNFGWGVTAGTTNTFISSDSGATWGLDTTTALLRVTTAATAGPAVSVPVLGLPALAALSLGVGAAGAGMARRRGRRASQGPAQSAR